MMNEEDLEKLIIDYVNDDRVTYLGDTKRFVESDTKLEAKVRKAFWKLIDKGDLVFTKEGKLLVWVKE